MKKMFMLLAITGMAATASVCKAANEDKAAYKPISSTSSSQPAASNDRELKEGKEIFAKATCKVTETWDDGEGNSGSVTVTVNCTCTAQQACDRAHALAALVVAG